jgi:hypothetical protein
LPLLSYPLSVSFDFGADEVRFGHFLLDLALNLRVTVQLAIDPDPELLGISHSPERSFLVLKLGAVLPALAYSARGLVDDSDASIPFVLVLATLAPRSESLDRAVFHGNCQKRLCHRASRIA